MEGVAVLLSDHFFAQLAQSQLDKEHLNAEIFLEIDLFSSTSTWAPSRPRPHGPNVTAPDSRGPWLAGRRMSSWRPRATSQCWACRRWGCPQLRIPHPGSASSQSPRVGEDGNQTQFRKEITFFVHRVQ